MTLKRMRGKTAFDYFSEEHFKMGCEGYRNVSEKQLGAYRILGSENYRKIAYASFEHALINAFVSGTNKKSRKFKILYRIVLDDYCNGVIRKYYSLKKENPDNEISFIYTPPTRRDMISEVEKRFQRINLATVSSNTTLSNLVLHGN